MFDYELIDSGNFRRLERFGQYILDRPALQATWTKNLKMEWEKADAVFDIKDKNNKFWDIKNKNLENPWTINIDKIKVELALATNGQIGIFPEQYINWLWINQIIEQKKLNNSEIKILNGFSYTGIASTTALTNSNVKIYNVDALKSTSKRFYKNLELSNLDKINTKFFIDDVISFFNREVKRGHKYDAFILDPPAFGRFKNKKWSILKDMPLLINFINKLKTHNFIFILISLHDERINKTNLKDYCKELLINKKIELIDLIIESKKGNTLPSGIALRITN